METTDLAIDLPRIAGDIWAAMLGLELQDVPAPADPTTVPGHDPTERIVTGVVQISGDWQGAVTVQLSHAFARRAAGLMFGMDDDEVTDEEVNDTVGELANMTGGNVKSLLAGSCQLSLPSVTTGLDYQVSIPGTRTTDRRGLDCDGELVVLGLLERQPTN